MKNLLQRVKQHTEKRPSPAKDAAKIFIIANRASIQQTLDHGYDVKAIWETLRADGKVDCSYSRFCQKLKKYLPVSAAHPSPVKNSLGKTVKPAVLEKPTGVKPDGFTFNANPNPEDLY